MSDAVRHLLLALVFVAAAIATKTAWDWYAERSTDVLMLPLDLKTGSTTSRPFTVIQNSNYEISFDVERVFSFDRTECLAGVGMPSPSSTKPGLPINCEAAFHWPQIDWTILEDGHPLPCKWASAEGAGSYGPTVGRGLCLTPMRTGAHYVAEVSLKNVSPNLAAAHPRFLVRLNAIDIEQGAFLSIFPTGVAIAFSGLALRQVLRSVRRSKANVPTAKDR